MKLTSPINGLKALLKVRLHFGGAGVVVVVVTVVVSSIADRVDICTKIKVTKFHRIFSVLILTC